MVLELLFGYVNRETNMKNFKNKQKFLKDGLFFVGLNLAFYVFTFKPLLGSRQL